MMVYKASDVKQQNLNKKTAGKYSSRFYKSNPTQFNRQKMAQGALV